MEEGALRVDANVSLRRPGDPLSTRTEIKNIGSIRGVAGAVKHEIERQRSVLEGGGRIINETRSWDAAAKATVPMRDKEVVQDYRYMPEPNLPPLRVNLKTKTAHQDIISVPLLRENLPELPDVTRSRLITYYQLRPEAAIQLVNEPVLLDYFQELNPNSKIAAKIANLLLNELLTVLNKKRLDVEDCPITIRQMKELIDLYLDTKINLEICKKVFDELVNLSDGNVKVAELIKEKDLSLISDSDFIVKQCEIVIENNPMLVKQFKEGKTKVFKALLGILYKNSHNKIDMSVASKVLERLLKQ